MIRHDFNLYDITQAPVIQFELVDSDIESRVARGDFSAVVREPGSLQRDRSTWIGEPFRFFLVNKVNFYIF